MDSGVLIYGVHGKIILSNVLVYDSDCKNTFIFVSSSILLIESSKFSIMQYGAIIMGKNQNNITIFNSSFENFFTTTYSLILIYSNNIISIESSKFNNASSNTNGAILSANENNNISIIYSNFDLCQSAGKGIIFISRLNQLYIEKCTFNNIQSQISAGVIYLTLASLTIKKSDFNDIESNNAGLIFANNSIVILENSIINQVKTSKGASILRAINCNVSISFSNFSNIIHKTLSDDSNCAMILITNKLLDKNWVFIQNTLFTYAGLNSNFLLSFENVHNLSLISNIFYENTVQNMINSLDCKFNFIINQSFLHNTFFNFLEITTETHWKTEFYGPCIF